MSIMCFESEHQWASLLCSHQALVEIHISVKVRLNLVLICGLRKKNCCQDVNLSALAQCYFILGEPEEAIIQDPGRGIQTSDMGDMGCQVAKILKDLLARGEKDLRYVWSLWGVSIAMEVTQ